MNAIREWLRRYGLERYFKVFHAHDIGLDILQDLTESELHELGVSMGDRKRMLRAISILVESEQPTPYPTEAEGRRSSADFPERRHLTVMFCDLKGSTLLSTSLELEDYRDVLRTYQSTCVNIINQYAGVVSRYVGDGLLVFFGHPEAHEDDAERAVRAALGVIDSISELNAREDLPENTNLAVRIGIASGLVIVGDIIGEDASELNAIVGETPNLAARLQALAEPDTVLVSDSVNNLIGRLFDVESVGDHDLKGFPEPVPVWRVTGERNAESRFDALHPSSLNPFVGRSEELSLLQRQWGRCVEGEGHVLVLSGEPGIGKSRAVKALRDSIESSQSLMIRYQCSPHHTNSALYPIIRQLELSAGFESDDTTREKTVKLGQFLEQYGGGGDQSLFLFGALLTIPENSDIVAVEMTPEKQKEATFGELLARVDILSHQQPLLIVFEDIHWIDPTTFELLQRYIEHSNLHRTLLVITCRPEFEFSWSRYPNLTLLTLSRLGREDVNAIIQNVAGHVELPVEVAEQIADKADGVALYVEEVTRSVVESELNDQQGRDGGPSWDSKFRIPSTLQDSLMARLDRLAPYKEIAQIGATIGREYSHRLISRVSQWTEQELARALDALTDSGLVMRYQVMGETFYRFKHALVQDTAYSSILRGEALVLHDRIAAALENDTSASRPVGPEIIAHHWTEAHDFAKAMNYWRKAGEMAAARSANAEAKKDFESALDALRHLPESDQYREFELDVLVELGAIQVAVDGYSTPVVENTYTRALDLSRELSETPELCYVLSGIAAYYCVSGQLVEGEISARRGLELATRIGESEHVIDAHRTLGEILFYAGKLDESRLHLEQCVDLYDIDEHADVAVTSGDDPAASCYMYLAIILWLTGDSGGAQKNCQAGLKLAQQLNHLHTLAAAQFNAAWFHALRREWQICLEFAKASVEICEEQRFPLFHGLATVLEGWALMHAEQVDTGVQRMQEGVSILRLENAGVCLSCFLPWLAEGLMAAGNGDNALSVLREACQSGDEHFYDSERLRLLGDIYAAEKFEVCDVEKCYDQALEAAHDRGMLAFELRTVLSMCSFMRDCGKSEDAPNVLQPVLGLIEADDKAPDSIRAQMLRIELLSEQEA